jgi:hypothetical protein
MSGASCPIYGGVAEWLKALVLKTRDAKVSVGSNPTSVANFDKEKNF